MPKTEKMTTVALRRMIFEELNKLREEKKSSMLGGKDRPEDVPASEEDPADGDVLEKQINFYKALKLEETRLSNRLKRLKSLQEDVKRKIKQSGR